MDVCTVSRSDAAACLAVGHAVIIEEFVQPQLADSFFKEAQASWKRNADFGSGWNLCMKSGATVRKIPTSSLRTKAALRSAFDTCNFEEFRYWYYSCFGAEKPIGPRHLETVNLIRKIEATLLTSGLFEVCEKMDLAPTRMEQRFSLTFFDNESFIDSHTDYSGEHQGRYNLTVLFYLDGPNEKQNGGELIFDRNGSTIAVKPKKNRLVLFRPSPQSSHRVVPNRDLTSSRLAFSGWYAQAR